MSDLIKDIDHLSPKKRQLFELLLAERRGRVSSQRIPRRGDVDSIPLSFSQERLWFLEQFEPNTPTFNLSQALRLNGPLDVKALEAALNEVLNRHEALSTTFHSEEGRPFQKISPPVTLRLPVTDLRGLPVSERETRARELLREASQHPFDLTKDVMLRAQLLRLDKQEHFLFVCVHHIAADGWSLGLLFEELRNLYRTFTAGLPSPLPGLPVQYADFALWQRQRLQGEMLDEQLGYWRKQLDGAPNVLDLPTDRPRPHRQTFRGDACEKELSLELSGALRELSQHEECTLFMTLLAAFQILLHRYSGQDDILVGTPVAGRTREEIERLIGFFVNTLVLRGDLSGNPTFREVLGRVREVAVGAYAHQDLPFEKLLEELHPERSLSRTPLFQVWINMFNFPVNPNQWPGLSAEALNFAEVHANFDLNLYMREEGKTIRFYLIYNTDLFCRERIVEMLEQLGSLLAQIAENPFQKIEDFSLVTPASTKVLPDPARPLGTEWRGAVHQQFSEQARRLPEKLAVADSGITWNYGELEAFSSQLANFLRDHGIGSEDKVAIYAHRSAPLVWAVLGILKAGAAFIILDPSYPAARLIDCVRAAVPKGWIELEAAGPLPESLEHFLQSSPYVCRLSLPSHPLTAATNPVGGCSTVNPKVPIGPDDLAYVAFTSGSTGKPKGILGRHGPLTHFLPWLKEEFDLGEGDRFSVLSGLAHDPLHRDIFTPLQLGASLHVPEPKTIENSARMVRWMREEQITISHLTPAMGQLLTDGIGEGPEDRIQSLRYVFLVGDVLTRRDVTRLRTLAPGVTVVNYYGSTETQRAVSYSVIQGDEEKGYFDGLTQRPLEKEILPLGHGIKDVQLLVLTRSQRLAGIGESGEICFRSPHLARGYLSDEALTLDRFSLNHFGSEPGDRLYRTGDLGRYLPDGSVEPLGRADLQVKIRGFRIELGEIETVLKKHPGLREAAVIAREDGPGQKRLVACLLPEKANLPSISELREYLIRKLPDYMIPARFVPLSEMPLTPNGKIDRRALAAIDDGMPQREAVFVPPRNPTEEVLAGIWAKVLEVEQVGIHDNFFELGGHSLLATRTMARIREAFSCNLPLARLFEMPTVAELAECITSARGVGTRDDSPVLRPVPRDVALPLSFGQQRLWFLDQLEPETTGYNMMGGVCLDGSLDLTAMEKAINEILRRHEILRTAFPSVEGQPVQRILPAYSFALPRVDLSGLSPSEKELRLQEIIREEIHRPFDLAQGPLFRFHLVRLGADSHVLLFNKHHIISDGWSAGVLSREVAVLYDAFTHHQESPLAELSIQYADFAVWQWQWLQGEVLDEEIAYWKRLLTDAPAVLELPTDRPRPATQSFAGHTMSFTLPKTLLESLRALSRQQGVTLFMTLLAAFKVLLSRYSGQQDIVVGSPIANRTRVELEGLIGFFVNTLVLRTDLSGNPTFRQLLGRVREVTLGAYAHQDLPFEKLVEELRPERDLSRSPIFQVLFVLQNAPMAPLELAGLTLRPLPIDRETSLFDLSLYLYEAGEGLQGTLEYNTDLFEAATIERMASHFRILLEAVAAAPEQPIDALSLLPEAERHRLLVEWNDTATDYPRDELLHQSFEAQVARTPGAMALVADQQQLTYGELNRRANQLAHHLRALGVGPETLVGICVERSVEMVVGLLGILKAGGAYVPLDPDFPRERVAFMLADSAVPLLVTQQRLRPELPAHQSRVLCLDTDWPRIAHESSDNPTPVGNSEHLAYVIYTSGSTGKPKGVQIPHRAVVNFLSSMKSKPGIDASDVLVAVTTLSFDIAGLELYLPLAVGARVVIASREMASDGHALTDAIERSAATLMQATPATWQLLLAAGWVGRPHLKVLCGGEALPLDLAQKLLSRCGQLWNLYGPTETTIWSTLTEVTATEQKISIGRPIANTEIYILDEQQQPVPVGVPGELCIGGAGLARGYLNRSELTAEKFIPHPFSSEPGARLYRTGDLARYWPDGRIEHLGRLDFQVKLRGFRIELGEIEAVLRQHDAVAEAAVVVREDQPGDKRLVAYVVGHGEREADFGELRNYLRSKLPDYMIPSSFVRLEAFPLTPNAKVDRRALPAPEGEQMESSDRYIAPRTPVEEVLVGIWSEVLGRNQVGINDNFFDLGGHSLLATRVTSRIREALHVDLSLRRMFEHPTVAGLADGITAMQSATSRRQMPPLCPVSRDSHLPLSYGQQRLWFLHQLQEGTTGYNISSAVRLDGSLNRAVLEQAIQEIVRRHEILRTSFPLVEGQPIQYIVPSLPFLLPATDLRQLPEAERENELQRFIREEAQHLFVLDRGPLWRAALFQCGDKDHVLVFTSHHIIFDGWSFGVLQKEMAPLYEHFSSGKPSPLSELPIQYADFAVWQRQWLQGEVLEEQMAYWKRQLADAPAVLELPTDRPRPAVQTYAGNTLTSNLPKALLETLHSLSRREGVTLFMTLLAAFKVLLARYCGQQDIVVGSPIANRTRVELEGLIGFFVNTLVLRTDLSGNPTFRQLLGRVRDVTLGAYSHQDLPFEKLVEELRPERDLSRSPLFQVLFVLQNAPTAPLELTGLTLRPLRIERGTSMFDLTLFLYEGEEGLYTTVEYNTDLFEASTIQGMMSHFQTLLEAAVADPEQSVATLLLLTESERRQLLVEWNNTAADYPHDQSLHQLFEAQVARTPEAVALVWGQQELTYGELNRRANQVAHHLRTLGVGQETLVGLCLERSVEMVVGLLGILKAGGAYVPLDPAYPKERLHFVLEDARVPLLLTQSSIRADLEAHLPDCRLVCLDENWPAVSKAETTDPTPTAGPNQLAYVIYTSGSTGKPKGVAIEHHSPVSLVQWAQQVFTPEELAGVLFSTSICFDLSVFELFVPLSCGGTVILVANALQLPTLPATRRVTLINTVPSAMAELLRLEAVPPSVGTINLAGEPLTVELVNKIHQLPHVRKVYDLYGPSETTTYSTFALRHPEGPYTIGRPVANTEIYILDEQRQPVPLGAPGELYIGGAGLARGYLNHPELTAEKFIPHPFSADPQARLYRTGDRARYRPNGDLEFLGRLDYQVKLRGFRIELGEIEAVLRQHEEVTEAVVVVREDRPAEKRLVAYVVGRRPEKPSFAELRNFLKVKLPDYMVPSSFVRLEVLPLTSNGKVNRGAMPAPEGVQMDSSEYFLAPRSPLEEVLADIWTEVLGREHIGIHDNFFDLGGHSLLSMRVVYEVEKRTGMRIHPRQLIFETLEQIAISCGAMKQPTPKAAATGITQKLLGALKGVLSRTD
jgi:amino acid adenylation domain-containing protein